MLDKVLIKKVLEAALTTSADFAEVFIEDKFQTIFPFEIRIF